MKDSQRRAMFAKQKYGLSFRVTPYSNTSSVSAFIQKRFDSVEDARSFRNRYWNPASRKQVKIIKIVKLNPKYD